ncbi:Swt1 family HEPN domain-containing protein [Methanogenium cariaci]
MGFTYDLPDSGAVFNTLKALLLSKNENKLYEIIINSDFNLASYEQYSRNHGGGRWDAFAAIPTFALPVAKMGEIDDQMKNRLKSYLNDIIPPGAGYDVTDVVISPKLVSGEGDSISLEEDLAEITDNILDSTGISYPHDLYEKGKEMAEVYLYLYHIENTLRIFIEEKGNGNLEYTSGLKRNIQKKKVNEENNKWKSFKAGSDIFYLDFVELADLISNNWTIFKDDFPDLDWIKTKIKEMAQCRNAIAHNGYIGDHEKDLLRLYYNSILRQINMKY